MERTKPVLVIILFILSIASYADEIEAAAPHEGENYKFLIYSSKYCGECKRLDGFLSQKFDRDSIFILSLENGNNSTVFLNIIKVLLNSSIPVQFPYCQQCMPKEAIGQFIDLLIL